MKLFLVLITAIMLTGCSSAQKMATSYNALVKQIPNNEFTAFEYHRTGWGSSAHIYAYDAAKDGDLIMIDSLNMQLNYGPENLTIKLEGYIREIE